MKPVELLDIQLRDVLREREFPWFLVVMLELAERLGFHPELTHPLYGLVREAAATLRPEPGDELLRDLLPGPDGPLPRTGLRPRLLYARVRI